MSKIIDNEHKLKELKAKAQKKKKLDRSTTNGQIVCRICLGEENEIENPLICPCKCSGTMKHIHIECLREWLKSKQSFKSNLAVKTYCWKALECELCRVRFPSVIYAENSKKYIELTTFDIPDNNYLVLESVTMQNIKIVHVVNLDLKDNIKIGRGHESDIRITDISVSRLHAIIKRTDRGDFYLQDNQSKFGTLVLVHRPISLSKIGTNYLQLGRSLVEIQIKEPKPTQRCPCLTGKKKAYDERSPPVYDRSDYFPDEFIAKKVIVDHTKDEEDKNKHENMETNVADNNNNMQSPPPIRDSLMRAEDDIQEQRRDSLEQDQ